MINSIQLLRACAASSVVFYHSGYQINGVNTDFQGVSIFFVISGFIMTYISNTSPEYFFARRVIRIVPLYWMITFLYILTTNLGLTNPLYIFPVLKDWATRDPMQILNWISSQNGITNNENISNIIKSLLFIPYVNSSGNVHPVLGVGWSLNLEMYFYLIFSIFIIFNSKIAPLFVFFTILIIKFIIQYFNPENGLIIYSNNYIFYFDAGIFLYYIYNYYSNNQIKLKYINKLIIILSPVIISIFICSNIGIFKSSGDGEPLNLTDIILWSNPILIFCLTLFVDKYIKYDNIKNILLLGNASYALYLSHPIIVETSRTIGDKIIAANPKDNISALIILIAICVLFSIFIFKFIERPIIGWFKSRLFAEK